MMGDAAPAMKLVRARDVRCLRTTETTRAYVINLNVVVAEVRITCARKYDRISLLEKYIHICMSCRSVGIVRFFRLTCILRMKNKDGGFYFVLARISSRVK